MAAQMAAQITAQMAGKVAPVHQLTKSEVLYELNHIHDDRRPDLICALTTTAILAYLCVALRLLSRKVGKSSLQADDFWIVLSLVSIKHPTTRA